MALLRHAAALVVGVLVGLAAVAVHRDAPPAGMLLAVVTSLALPWRLRVSRFPRTASTYAGGWLALFAVVVLGRPEGDFALASDVRGYGLMTTGMVLVVVGLVGLVGTVGVAGTRERTP